MKIARAPQIAARRVSPAFLDPVDDFLGPDAVDGERGAHTVEQHFQARQVGAGHNFVLLVTDRQAVGDAQRRIYRRFVRPDIQRRPQVKVEFPVALQYPVVDVDRVLAVGQQQALLENKPVDLVSPRGQPHVEAELAQEVGAMNSDRCAGPFLAAELHLLTVRQLDVFDEVVEHHDAAQRSGQSRNQVAVKAAAL